MDATKANAIASSLKAIIEDIEITIAGCLMTIEEEDALDLEALEEEKAEAYLTLLRIQKHLKRTP